MNVGPWILPSGSPSNSSRVVNSMVYDLGRGGDFWVGDSGGAGGSAGERAGDGLDAADVVMELSD